MLKSPFQAEAGLAGFNQPAAPQPLCQGAEEAQIAFLYWKVGAFSGTATVSYLCINNFVTRAAM